MVRVIFSPKSLRQIREISEYIAVDSKRQSFRVVQRILASVKRLENFPESGVVIPEAVILGEMEHEIREIRVFHYRVLHQFQENDAVVRIVAVVHGARQLTDEMIED